MNYLTTITKLILMNYKNTYLYIYMASEVLSDFPNILRQHSRSTDLLCYVDKHFPQ